MYEITYSMDGILKKININANDEHSAFMIFTNMYSGQRIEIINIRRV